MMMSLGSELEDFINLSCFAVNLVWVPKPFLDWYTRFFLTILLLPSHTLAEEDYVETASLKFRQFSVEASAFC